MCESCFTEELRAFPDKASWDMFDLELTQKLSLGQIKYLSFKNTGYKDFGYYLYECQSCGQKWRLSEPDNADRGCFLKQ